MGTRSERVSEVEAMHSSLPEDNSAIKRTRKEGGGRRREGSCRKNDVAGVSEP